MDHVEISGSRVSARQSGKAKGATRDAGYLDPKRTKLLI